MQQTITPELRSYRIAAAAFFFLQGTVFASWTSRIADVKHALKLNDEQLGAVLFALPVGQFLAMMLSGYMVSKIGSKRVVLIGALLYPAMLFALAFAPNAEILFCTLFFFGICVNLHNIAINTQAVGVEGLYDKPIMASFHGLWSFACFVWVGFSFLFATHLSLFQHFLIVNVFTLCIVLTMWRKLLPADRKAAEPDAKGRTRSFLRPTKFIALLGLITFCSMASESTIYDWSVVYFDTVVDSPDNLIRLGYLCYMAAMMTGRFSADKLVARFGIMRILQISGLTVSFGLLLAAAFPHTVVTAVAFTLMGFGVSSIVPLCYSAAGKSKRMVPGMAIASVSMIGFIAFIVSPPIIGYVGNHVSLRLSFAIFSLFGVSLFFITRSLKNRLQD